jgi:hypothetical protein
MWVFSVLFYSLLFADAGVWLSWSVLRVFGGFKKLLLLVYLWAKIYICLMKYELFVEN